MDGVLLVLLLKEDFDEQENVTHIAYTSILIKAFDF